MVRAGHLIESSNRPPPTRPRSHQDGWGDDRTRIGVRGTVCYAGLPLLRPFALGYAPFPRTVEGEGAQQTPPHRHAPARLTGRRSRSGAPPGSATRPLARQGTTARLGRGGHRTRIHSHRGRHPVTPIGPHPSPGRVPRPTAPPGGDGRSRPGPGGEFRPRDPSPSNRLHRRPKEHHDRVRCPRPGTSATAWSDRRARGSQHRPRDG